jgi:shikimate kinase
MKNIALIGFMGSGKSTLARLLADKLDYDLCEIDDDIVKASNYSSVNEIFDSKGEGHFRELEMRAIANSIERTNQVISCGGGVVTSDEGMQLLKKNAIIVFLHADFKTITKRLIDTSSRPLFRDMEKATALFAKRLPLYKKYANIEIETDDVTPEKVAELILAKLTQYEL